MEEPNLSLPHLAGSSSEDDDDQLHERVRSLRLPHSSGDADSSRSSTPWFFCLIFALVAAAFAYLYFTKNPPPAATQAKTEKSSKPAASNAPAAKSPAAPSAASGDVVLQNKGYIIPTHQILVSPKVNGMVVKLNIIESKRVAKGDILAELENTEFLADCNRAKATLELAKQNLTELERGYRPEEIAQAKAELAEAQAQLTQLEADYKRSAELLAKRVHSKEQYDATLSKYQAMEKRVQKLQYAHALMEKGPREERIAVARAQVQQAEAELAKAQWRLSNCVIRAPISGTILKKNAEEGSLVNPIAMQGFYSLCEMADLSDLEVELMIQERDISKVFKDQKCKIRADAFPDRNYEGYVSRLMPTADRGRGAIPVRVKVIVPAQEEGVYLKPEMGAIVSFLKK